MIGLFLIFCQRPLSAQSNPEPTKLHLKPSEAQIRLLNQKLEFHVKDSKSIFLGNLLISTDNLKISKIDDSSILLIGPKQFMVGGLLIIKDPHGEAIWSERIKSPKDLALNTSDASIVPESPPTAPTQTAPSKPANNTEVAQYVLHRFDKYTDKLASTSFFNFCIFIETTTNRIQTCTPNYSIALTENDWELTPFETKEDENTIIVNGTEVNDHGIIQFDQNINIVSLAAKMSSGLSLEVKTETIPLDILDAYTDSNKVHLKLREKSANPNDISSWETVLNPTDTYFYVEAFGQAPLRQEITLTPKDLPTDSDRPVVQNPIAKTYGAAIALNIQNQPDTTFKAKTKNEKTFKQKNFTKWTMTNLQPGLTSHSIQVKNKTTEYVGTYEITKLPPWEINIQGGSYSSSIATKASGISGTTKTSSFQYELSGRRYFDQFWGITQTSEPLRWSTTLGYLTKSVNNEKITGIRLDLGYRWSSSAHHSEPGVTTRLAVLQLTESGPGNSNSISLLGIHLAYDNQVSFWKSFLGDSYEANLEFYPVSQSSQKQTIQFLKGHWQSRFQFKANYFWTWSVAMDSYQTKAVDLQSTAQSLSFTVGIGALF